MVMGLLCDVIALIGVEVKAIYVIYPTGDVFGYTATVKHHFLDFLCFSCSKISMPTAPTFEIYGHGDSV